MKRIIVKKIAVLFSGTGMLFGAGVSGCLNDLFNRVAPPPAADCPVIVNGEPDLNCLLDRISDISDRI